MNKVLLKANLKQNYKVFLIFLTVLVFYMSIIISMYDPEGLEALEAMLESFPKELLLAMGFNMIDSSLTAFISGYFYGFLIIIFPMIFTIMLSFRLVGKYVDNGSMSYILSTPNTRTKVIITQAVFLILSIFTLILVTTVTGITISSAMFPGLLNNGKFILLNLGAFLLFFLISGICFFCSSFFNEGRLSLSTGIAIPVGFFIINMLQAVDSRLEFFKFFTIFSLFNNERIIQGDSLTWLYFLVMVVVGFGFYVASIYVFRKKDLHI